MTPAILNPSNHDELALFAAACWLAPWLWMARHEAYGLDAAEWREVELAQKEAYILRCMELLKTLRPAPTKCIWCGIESIDPHHDPYCSTECGVSAACDQ